MQVTQELKTPGRETHTQTRVNNRFAIRRENLEGVMRHSDEFFARLRGSFRLRVKRIIVTRPSSVREFRLYPSSVVYDDHGKVRTSKLVFGLA